MNSPTTTRYQRIDFIQGLFGWKSKQPVYKLIKEGLPHLKINGQLWFDPEPVNEWFKEKIINGK